MSKNRLTDYKGDKKLFSVIEHLDYYDGDTSGIAQASDLDMWFAFNLVYVDVNSDLRYFLITSVSSDWVRDFQLKNVATDKLPYQKENWDMLEAVFKKNIGQIYLLRAWKINSVPFEIVRIPNQLISFTKDLSIAFSLSKEKGELYKNLFQTS